MPTKIGFRCHIKCFLLSVGVAGVQCTKHVAGKWYCTGLAHKAKRTAYSTLRNHRCTSSFSSSGTPHLEANREREKRKTAVGTKRQTSFSKCPTTRNSAPRVSKRARTSATPSHEAKLERQPELQPGRYTTRTPQEGRSWPVARLSQEH